VPDFALVSFAQAPFSQKTTARLFCTNIDFTYTADDIQTVHLFLPTHHRSRRYLIESGGQSTANA
jgi:hypothetical protein